MWKINLTTKMILNSHYKKNSSVPDYVSDRKCAVVYSVCNYTGTIVNEYRNPEKNTII